MLLDTFNGFDAYVAVLVVGGWVGLSELSSGYLGAYILSWKEKRTGLVVE